MLGFVCFFQSVFVSFAFELRFPCGLCVRVWVLGVVRVHVCHGVCHCG